MAITETLSPVGGGILRIIAALLGKRSPVPQKFLRARIGMRAIVSELPEDLPFKIMDDSGHAHQGIYALNVLVWNKGSEEITPSDFLDNAPLRLAVRKESYVIMASVLANDDQLTCSALQVDEQNVDICFDCINPGDYLNIVLFYGGQSMADVEILGRIRGQATSIDQQAEEVKASIGERIISLGILSFILNMFVGLPISAWLIYRDYGFEELLQPSPNIPRLVLTSFGTGIMLVSMLIISRLGMCWERRRYPPGYPLHSDFEPPLIENIKGMFLTAFTAKKQRLSTSIFSWAKPIIVRQKKSKRLSVDDWMA